MLRSKLSQSEWLFNVQLKLQHELETNVLHAVEILFSQHLKVAKIDKYN